MIIDHNQRTTHSAREQNRQCRSWRRSIRGQGLTEITLGCTCVVPICLLFLDLGTFVLANTANEYLAKDAARAAASAVDESGKGSAKAAKNAAESAVNRFKTSPIISERLLKFASWNGQVLAGSDPTGSKYSNVAGQVCVITTIKVVPPAPFPGICDKTFTAHALVPIVSIPSNQS